MVNKQAETKLLKEDENVITQRIVNDDLLEKAESQRIRDRVEAQKEAPIITLLLPILERWDGHFPNTIAIGSETISELRLIEESRTTLETKNIEGLQKRHEE